ncbi:hypothetical protein MTO96_049542 [Rhipicephalus appendiculatus]
MQAVLLCSLPNLAGPAHRSRKPGTSKVDGGRKISWPLKASVRRYLLGRRTAATTKSDDDAATPQATAETKGPSLTQNRRH